jgi:hypothetical protein
MSGRGEPESRGQAEPLTRDERRQRAGVTDEFVRADPRMRRLAIAVVAVGAVVGAVATGWLTPLITRAAEQGTLGPLPATTRALCWLFLGLVSLLTLPIIAFGAYAIRLGRRVRTHGRYPPPDMKVVRDTRILVGSAAQIVGKGQVVIGAVMIACAVSLAAWSVYAVTMLLRRS